MVELGEAGHPRRIGPYRLVRPLGRGEMGRVYLGRARRGRLAAVKILDAGLAADAAFRHRLALEVAAARRVDGFYTARLIDADLGANPPWLAADYVPGPSLQEAVAACGRLPYEAVQAMGLGLAEGLAAIHDRGLPHRDLHPGNVILAEDGPRLTDFALARALDGVHRSTRAPESAGFMPPEQALGYPTGPASDVFSLACVLAFAATGRGPYGHGPAVDVLGRVVGAEPDLSAVPGPLKELLGDCLAKNPAARPALAEILQRLAGPAPGTLEWLPPPVASMVGAHQTAARTGPDNPGRRTLLAAAGTGVLAAIAIPVTIALATRPSARFVPPDDAAADTIRFTPPQTIELDTTEALSSIAFSPDGAILAATVEGGVQLWDAATRKRLTTLDISGTDIIRRIAFGPNGLLGAGYPDMGRAFEALEWDIGTITMWDVATRREYATLSTETEGKVGLFSMEAVAFSPDGTMVAGARDGKDCIGKVPLWNIADKKMIDLLTVGEGEGVDTSAVRSVACSPDGAILAAGYGVELEGGIALWDAASRTPITRLKIESTDAFGVSGLVFSPDGKALFACYGGVALWDLTSHEIITTFVGDAESGYQSIALSPDGTLLAASTIGEDTGGVVTVWSTATAKEIAVMEMGRSVEGALAFSPDGKTLACATDSAKLFPVVQLWTIA
ncbi:protein kinase [Actinorhabdospora filicis]|uniref:Protein kinase n=1 Tax=Actinorhabdospora filicis TaxID=1785913 RepID=A0A9W6SKV7_9ACTN|nr:serine/threonine-protein kinase [Actinorhabdospora filicis]GLZ78108.1 protein kinase [Actinorhabdospora filicis]